LADIAGTRAQGANCVARANGCQLKMSARNSLILSLTDHEWPSAFMPANTLIGMASAAYASGGDTMKDVGDYFGPHYSRVSKIVPCSKRRAGKRKDLAHFPEEACPPILSVDLSVRNCSGYQGVRIFGTDKGRPFTGARLTKLLFSL
jgi:hypothetical protein